MSRSTFADVVELIVGRFVHDAFGTTASLLAPGVLAPGGDSRFVTTVSRTQDDAAEVKGVQESGTEDDGHGGRPAATPALATPFGDGEASSNSLISLLLLVGVFVSAWFLVRGISQALR